MRVRRPRARGLNRLGDFTKKPCGVPILTSEFAVYLVECGCLAPGTIWPQPLRLPLAPETRLPHAAGPISCRELIA
jgi:hypothetical protein